MSYGFRDKIEELYFSPKREKYFILLSKSHFQLKQKNTSVIMFVHCERKNI